ncbi:MAG: class I SAM-dependent methyltransferase [Magnetospirillum sp.]|nr:class I SAM-dependent methyltransferase [Magnetospirillum sp.]
MSQASNPCPVCGGARRDWATKQGRLVQRCVACRLVLVPAGVATGPTGVSIYEEEVPIFAADGNLDYYLDDAQFENFRIKLDWVRRYLPDGARLLDAGANYGHFLKLAQAVYRTEGFDISPAAVAYSRTQFGVDNVVASIYALPAERSGPYDGIVNFDVIEHVDDPRRALQALRATMKPGALLFVTTPDAGSLVATLMGLRWHYLDPVQHIVLFDRANLQSLLAQTGFETLAMRTIGHRYRLSYVLDRLCYLNRDGVLSMPLRLARWLLRPLRGLSVAINAGDVMGIVARRSDGPNAA